jgi:hypothetical protein
VHRLYILNDRISRCLLSETWWVVVKTDYEPDHSLVEKRPEALRIIHLPQVARSEHEYSIPHMPKATNMTVI